MNWEAISAIGEITGAIAVIITVGYFVFSNNTNEFDNRAFTKDAYF